MTGERFFWLRVALILIVAILIGTAGVLRVEVRSAGIRDAARLAAVDDERREASEVNRQLEAKLVGALDPVEMLEDADRRGMPAPDPEQTVEVP